ncbi:UNVERIFIED_CONTAM: Protein CHAPERONE-LIKE PROTEIN OF POR1, chloroplastic [Sesamum indicum]
MSSGLTYCPLRYSLGSPTRGPGSHKKHVAFFPDFRTSKDLLYLPRNGLAASTWRYKRRTPSLKCAMDATFGDATNDSTDVSSDLCLVWCLRGFFFVWQWQLYVVSVTSEFSSLFILLGTAIFPRINVNDPYKRLGISREASEDEIQAARNFLIQTYGGHKPSVDAIESAHDKIIMQKFYERKNPKINIKKKVREVTQSRYVQAVASRFRTPSTSVIIKTSIAFIALGLLTVLFPTEEGPTLQVAISLIITVYFIYDRLKSKLRAFLYGNISDGVCDATNTQGAKKLGSDNFIDKLHYPLGFFYLSSIICFYTCPSFVRLTVASSSGNGKVSSVLYASKSSLQHPLFSPGKSLYTPVRKHQMVWSMRHQQNIGSIADIVLSWWLSLSENRLFHRLQKEKTRKKRMVVGEEFIALFSCIPSDLNWFSPVFSGEDIALKWPWPKMFSSSSARRIAQDTRALVKLQ